MCIGSVHIQQVHEEHFVKIAVRSRFVLRAHVMWPASALFSTKVNFTNHRSQRCRQENISSNMICEFTHIQNDFVKQLREKKKKNVSYLVSIYLSVIVLAYYSQ